MPITPLLTQSSQVGVVQAGGGQQPSQPSHTADIGVGGSPLSAVDDETQTSDVVVPRRSVMCQAGGDVVSSSVRDSLVRRRVAATLLLGRVDNVFSMRRMKQLTRAWRMMKSHVERGDWVRVVENARIGGANEVS